MAKSKDEEKDADPVAGSRPEEFEAFVGAATHNFQEQDETANPTATPGADVSPLDQATAIGGQPLLRRPEPIPAGDGSTADDIAADDLLAAGGSTVADFDLAAAISRQARTAAEPTQQLGKPLKPRQEVVPNLDDLPDAFGPGPEDEAAEVQTTAHQALPAHTTDADVVAASGFTDPGGVNASFEENEIVEGEAVSGDWSNVGDAGSFDTGRGESGDFAAGSDPGSSAARPARGSSPRDHWAGFDEEKSGWESVTGQERQSKVGRKPAAPKPQHDDGEYSRRQTNVYGRNKKRQAAQGGRLVCIKGKDQAREFPVDQREITVGRDPRNDIVLEEPSASRMHGSILFDGDKYSLVDNNSGNGTFLNGDRIDRARLRSGDEIGFGNGVFRFLELGDVFKPVDASGAPVLPGARRSAALEFFAGRKGIALAAGIVLLAAVAVVAVLVVRAGGRQPNPEVTFRYYMQGIEAFKRHDWSAAETHFTLMLGHDPTHPRGQQYLRAVAREREADERLRTAKAARDRGDLTEAVSGFEAIMDSVFASEAREQLASIQAALDAKVALARSALDAGQPQQALRSLEDVEQVHPGRPDVAALRYRAMRALGRDPNAAPVPVNPASGESSRSAPSAPATHAAGRSGSGSGAPHPQSGRASRVAPKSGSGRSGGGGATVSKPSNGGNDVLSKAKDLVGHGKLADAVALLASEKGRDAAVLKKKIEKFTKLYKGALADHGGKKTASAIKLFKQARSYEAKITGGSTPLAAEIQRKLADMHYIDGLDALRKKKYPEAYKSFRTALSVSPGHKLTLRRMSDLVAIAKKTYEDGYVAVDSGDAATAKKKFKSVLQIVSSDNEYYKKSKQRLAKLGK